MIVTSYYTLTLHTCAFVGGVMCEILRCIYIGSKRDNIICCDETFRK